MSFKSGVKFAILAIVVNLMSVFMAIFGIWSAIYLVFLVFIINNRDSNKMLRDKKVFAFIQAFMLVVFTFIFTMFGVAIFPIMYHVVQTYLADFYYPLLILGIIGLIMFIYLFIKLLKEPIKVLKLKETRNNEC